MEKQSENSRDHSREYRREALAQSQWFILDGPAYQGPYGVDEVRDLLKGHALTQECLFWRPELTDWLTAQQIPELKNFADCLVAASPHILSRQSANLAADLAADLAPSRSEIQSVSDYASQFEEFGQARALAGSETEILEDSTKRITPFSGDEAWSEFVQKSSVKRSLEEQREIADRLAANLTANEIVVRQARQAFAPNTESKAAKKKRYLELALAATAVIFATTALMVIYIAPKLLSHQQTIGRFDDLNAEDRQELETVLSTAFKKRDPKAALAVSTTDYFAPAFFIATNLPDGTTLNLQIDGIPESLVDRFKISVRTSVIIKDGLAKPPVFRQDDGTPYPMGQYRVSVTCPSCVSAGISKWQMLAQKAFFLGQEVANGDYKRSLKSYHARLKTVAQDELTELKQFSESLENQLTETDTTFQAEFVRGLPVASRASRWLTYHTRWVGFQEQLEAAFARWTPEALDGGYYYADLFTRLKKLGERTSLVHQAQFAYMSSGQRDPAKRDLINRDGAETKALIQELQTKVRRTSELPQTAKGMPPRLIEQ